MTDWFRSWHGAPTDHKWLVVARKAGTVPGIVSAVVWALFDHASQQVDRGDVQGFDVETYAAASGFEETLVHKIIAALTDKGLIADYRLTAWEKRQPKREDDSTARVALHRERNAEKRDVTQRNAPEKSREETDTEQKQNTSSTEDAAASAPDARALLFNQGLQELSSMTGRPTTKLRALLGRWLQAADDDALRVLSLISKAKQDRPAEPIAFIEGHFKPKTGPPANGAKPLSGSQEMTNAIHRLRNPEPTDQGSDRGPVETLEASEFRRAG